MLEPLSPSVWRLPLPSKTMPPFEDTNSYLVASDGVGVVVDAGFHDPAALEQLGGALKQAGVRVLKALLLTHTHPDHVAGVPHLTARYPELPVYLHPDEFARLEHPRARALQDERVITVGNRTLRALHTPGHSPGHLSFHVEPDGVVLTGDLVAGQGSTWVGYPEGDVAAYLASLEKLRALAPRVLGPGHGEAIRAPEAKLREARAHRLARLEEVYRALADGPKTLSELRERIYPEVPEALTRMTERSVLALLKVLMHEMRVLHLGDSETGPYAQRR